MYGIGMDLGILVAIWVAGAVLMIPLLGLSARFGLVPLLDAVSRLRHAAHSREVDEETAARVAHLEMRLSQLRETVARMATERGAREAQAR